MAATAPRSARMRITYKGAVHTCVSSYVTHVREFLAGVCVDMGSR